MRRILAALVPGASALAAGGGVLLVPALAAPVTHFLDTYPLLLPGVGVLLALAYRRRRALYAAALVGVASWVWTQLPAWGEELAQAVAGAVAVLLPVNFALLGLAKERAPWSGAGLAGLLLLGAQLLAVAFAWEAYLVDMFAALWRPIFLAPWAGPMPLPHLSVVMFGTAFLVQGVRAALHADPLDGGLWWAGVGCLGALVRGAEVGGATVLWASGAMAVIASLVAASARWAFHDPLTGLPGRRACDEALAELDGAFTIAVVDIDHFKGVNDRFGHAAGDQVLRMVAARLKEVGGAGRAFRFGGEEFVIIFPQRTLERCLPFLEAVHRAIAATPFRLRGADRPRRRPKQIRPSGNAGPALTVTVSMGVAQAGPGAAAVEEVLGAADRALYRAKAEGRNRICTA